MMDMYNLFVLSVCQVCGSYQCPYCPVFSSSLIGAMNMHLIIICSLASVLVSLVYVWNYVFLYQCDIFIFNSNHLCKIAVQQYRTYLYKSCKKKGQPMNRVIAGSQYSWSIRIISHSISRFISSIFVFYYIAWYLCIFLYVSYFVYSRNM